MEQNANNQTHSSGSRTAFSLEDHAALKEYLIQSNLSATGDKLYKEFALIVYLYTSLLILINCIYSIQIIHGNHGKIILKRNYYLLFQRVNWN